MTHLYRAMAVAALFGISSPALANEGGVYVTVFGGIDAPDEEKIDGRNAAGDLRDIDVALDDGKVIGAALGVAGADSSWGRLRAEVEFSFRKSDLEGLTLNGVPRTVVDGSDVSIGAGMLNAYFDTPKLLDRLRFGVGAGFGVASVNHEIGYLIAVPPAIGTIPGQVQIAIPSSETGYAYQLIGMAEVELSRNLSLIGDVRYFDLGDVQVERFVLNSFINGVPTTTGTLDSILDADYSTTSFTVGIRYKF